MPYTEEVTWYTPSERRPEHATVCVVKKGELRYVAVYHSGDEWSEPGWYEENTRARFGVVDLWCALPAGPDEAQEAAMDHEKEEPCLHCGKPVGDSDYRCYIEQRSFCSWECKKECYIQRGIHQQMEEARTEAERDF